MSELPLITPDWSGSSGIVAYTTTRCGGVSNGVYASLNVGNHVGDDALCVAQNRARLPHADKITWLHQVHSSRVITVPSDISEADAVISRTPGVYCAVMTADCVPVLLCNTAGTEVAAVHAGWKGLDLDIIANTINAMHSPAEQIIAWIGPAICADHYEVDKSLTRRFSAIPDAVQGVKGDKAHLNLPMIAAWQINECGIGAVTQSNLCTYSDSQRFFSHRRATHEGRTASGRMASVIGISE